MTGDQDIISMPSLDQIIYSDKYSAHPPSDRMGIHRDTRKKITFVFSLVSPLTDPRHNAHYYTAALELVPPLPKFLARFQPRSFNICFLIWIPQYCLNPSTPELSSL